MRRSVVAVAAAAIVSVALVAFWWTGRGSDSEAAMVMPEGLDLGADDAPVTTCRAVTAGPGRAELLVNALVAALPAVDDGLVNESE